MSNTERVPSFLLDAQQRHQLTSPGSTNSAVAHRLTKTAGCWLCNYALTLHRPQCKRREAESAQRACGPVRRASDGRCGRSAINRKARCGACGRRLEEGRGKDMAHSENSTSARQLARAPRPCPPPFWFTIVGNHVALCRNSNVERRRPDAVRLPLRSPFAGQAACSLCSLGLARSSCCCTQDVGFAHKVKDHARRDTRRVPLHTCIHLTYSHAHATARAASPHLHTFTYPQALRRVQPRTSQR
jgi:hypothetical protein